MLKSAKRIHHRTCITASNLIKHFHVSNYYYLKIQFGERKRKTFFLRNDKVATTFQHFFFISVRVSVIFDLPWLLNEHRYFLFPVSSLVWMPHVISCFLYGPYIAHSFRNLCVNIWISSCG